MGGHPVRRCPSEMYSRVDLSTRLARDLFCFLYRHVAFQTSMGFQFNPYLPQSYDHVQLTKQRATPCSALQLLKKQNDL